MADAMPQNPTDRDDAMERAQPAGESVETPLATAPKADGPRDKSHDVRGREGAVAAREGTATRREAVAGAREEAVGQREETSGLREDAIRARETPGNAAGYGGV